MQRGGASKPWGWWKMLDVDDPVTLEPLSGLPYPPFEVGPSELTHYFDGAVLATYIVSQGRFENPLTREALSREDCRRLDQYVTKHCPEWTGGRGGATVTDSYDLQQTISVRGAGGGSEAEQQRAMSLRREATTALLGLFEFRGVSWHRGRRSQAARQDPGLTIIDDDEDLGSFASAGGGEGGEEFPWLSERIEGIGVQGASADPTYSRLAQDLERARVTQQAAKARAAREARAKKEAIVRADAEYRAKRKEELIADAVRKEEEERVRVRVRGKREAADAASAEAEWRLVLEVQSVEAAVKQREHEEEQRRKEEARIQARNDAEKEAEEAAAEAEKAREKAEEEKREREREKKRRQREKEKAKKAEQREKREGEAAVEEAKRKEEEAKKASAMKCAMCTAGIIKDPFVRLEFKYCTTRCVQEHRKQLGR